jgi:drug/metabolite transporter (DMT)-like permease
VVLGVLASGGQWLVILAHRIAPASLLAPFFYSQLLWVTGLGFLVFGNLPDGWTIAGATIIIASGLYTAHRERVRPPPPNGCGDTVGAMLRRQRNEATPPANVGRALSEPP